MEDYDISQVIYAMYLTLEKKKREELHDNQISDLEKQFLGMLNKKQLEIYEKIQKMYAKQQEFDEKSVVRFVINFIKNLV